MRAAILAIGDELTLGQNVDTNSAWLAARLVEHSIITIEHRTVPDDREAIAKAVRSLALKCNLVLTSGGLGPTADDLTREALGDVLSPGQELVADRAATEQIQGWFHNRGRIMPPLNAKQGLRPDSMRCLANPNGTAPGLAGQLGECFIFCMPGPPREMQPMFDEHVAPSLKGLSTGLDEVVLLASVREFGMGESDAAQRLGLLMDRDRNPLVGTTASDAIVTARIRARGPRPIAERQLEQTIEEIEKAWYPYSIGSELSLEAAVGSLLRQAGKTLATAESCTGGWLGKTLVDHAGASQFYLGGWITYSDQAKSHGLRVPPNLIERHGAVSTPVAKAMAQGALDATTADYSLAITGIAGPEGGTPAKPVGTIHIALGQKFPERTAILARHFEFAGDRTAIRDRSVKAALQMLRFALLNIPDEVPLLWEKSQTARAQIVPVQAAQPV